MFSLQLKNFVNRPILKISRQSLRYVSSNLNQKDRYFNDIKKIKDDINDIKCDVNKIKHNIKETTQHNESVNEHLQATWKQGNEIGKIFVISSAISLCIMGVIIISGP
jgi:chromosome segregation ATPase